MGYFLMTSVCMALIMQSSLYFKNDRPWGMADVFNSGLLLIKFDFPWLL